MNKVLVVDDSALMRRLLSSVLDDAGFEVAIARNGSEGIRQLTAWEPDVLTLDINMPEMDGLTALSLMMQARPTPVVMVSSLTHSGAQATFEALALGAVDFIAKPGGTISLSVDDIRDELLAKVRAAMGARLHGAAERLRSSPRPRPTRAAAPAVRARDTRVPRAARPMRSFMAPDAAVTPTGQARCPGVVLVGVSTGGPRTLEEILPLLPAGFPWPVVVAQHMPAQFTQAFAQRMDQLCALRVREVNATVPLEPGHIYIGQGGSDVALVERLGRLAAQPRPEHPDHPWHPSVDVLVQSAMALLPPRQIVGVQLTGMGYDGAAAMTQLHLAGGRTIAEAESTAVVFGMPRELIERQGASTVLPCQDVASQLCRWLQS